MEKGNKIILVLGIIAFAAGIFVFSRELSFRKNAVQTEGTVISTIGSSFRVQYFTNDGTEKTKQFSAKSNYNREGDAKKVWYLPDNPDKVKLSNGTQGGRTLLIAGLFCILLGISPLLIRKKSASGQEK